MEKTWILVAHRGGARLFEHPDDRSALAAALIHKMDHPAGKLKGRDIDTDKHGRSFDSRGASRHAYATEETPVDHVADVFAQQIAGFLDTARAQQRFAKLVLVAEPRFLGKLRAAMTTSTAAHVVATVGKDLAHIDTRELPHHLAEVLAS